MQRVLVLSKRILSSYHKLPEKKKYLEFYTALLSIPLIITAIILNVNALNNLNKTKTDNNTTNQKPNNFFPAFNFSAKPTGEVSATPALTPTSSECKKELGPIGISSPQEGDTVTDNPVSVTITYDTDTYCPAVWSYRINGSSWSDYDDKSIALYNLPQGKITLDLRAKSLIAKDEATITRTFINKGTSTVNVSPSTILSPGVQGASTSAR